MPITARAIKVFLPQITRSSCPKFRNESTRPIHQVLVLAIVGIAASNPHLYNPYYNLFRQAPYFNGYDRFGNYANQVPSYSPLVPTYTENLLQDKVAAAYLSTPDILPNLNIMAEIPYSVSNSFTVVPMLVVSDENMNFVSHAQVMGVAKDKPIMTVKSENQILQCTPAVRIVLEKPIIVYSLKTSILFPQEIQVVHQGYNIPIRVGAVIAPVKQNTYVSVETPVSVDVVYAVPTRPIRLDYINNEDAIIIPETQAVVVESDPVFAPPKNVTILEFPDKEAEPNLDVDEEDDELVNRNPPIVLAPAGIVQSTQPISSVEPFTNSKESPVLIALREEAKKRI